MANQNSWSWLNPASWFQPIEQHPSYMAPTQESQQAVRDGQPYGNGAESSGYAPYNPYNGEDPRTASQRNQWGQLNWDQRDVEAQEAARRAGPFGADNFNNLRPDMGQMVFNDPSSLRPGAQQQTANPFQNIKSLMPSSDAGSLAQAPSMISKLGNYAKMFKPLSKGGNTIGGLMGNSKMFSAGGKLAGIGAAPAWAIPAAGVAAFGVKHLMKRSKQKKQQKQMNSQRDQIKNAAANGQYMQGNLGNFSGPQNF